MNISTCVGCCEGNALKQIKFFYISNETYDRIRKHKMIDLNIITLTNTLNINATNTPIKKEKLSDSNNKKKVHNTSPIFVNVVLNTK